MSAPRDPWSPVSSDPRSTEWRDPDAQPWWAARSTPQAPAPVPPPAPRRSRWVIALGAAVLFLIGFGVVLAAARGGSKPDPTVAQSIPAPVESVLPAPGVRPSALPQDSGAPRASLAPTDDTDPVSVTKAYYGDLAADNTTAAWNLLCQPREAAMPLSDYAAAYEQDVATGTGVTSFTQTGRQLEQGDAAAVPGTLVLADHESVPITVLLVQEGAAWRVCSSDLGGVLPNPGTGTASPTSGVTT